MAAVLGLVGVAAAPAGSAGATPATGPARPDLRVPAGAVHGAGGRLVGAFTVRDTGRGAGPFSVVLAVRTAERAVVAKRYALRLGAGRSRTVRVAVAVPAGLPAGRASLRVCADATGRVAEQHEANNCRTVGHLTTAAPAPISSPSTPTPAPVATDPPDPIPAAPAASSAPAAPADTTGSGGGSADPPAEPEPPSSSTSTVPTAPVAFTAETVFTLDSAWVDVPRTYDRTHHTPAPLLVWLHGCGGESRYDIDDVTPGPTDTYIAITVGGREGQCWNPDVDQAKVLTAIADIETHFNIDRRRIVLGGYSSGGDLTYRTAFYHANLFAGVLVENSTPFRDTGSTATASIAAASWKFPVVQLAHRQDTTYPLATVRTETTTLGNAGFPVTLVERDGTHYDANTEPDVRTYLLPHLHDGWTAPG